MNLYEMTTEYRQALTELEDSDFDPQTIADTLEGMKGNLEVKAKNVAAFIANRKVEIEAVKAASKKLAERAKTEQARLDSLSDYLKYNMEASGITEIRSPELLLKIKKNPVKLVIDDSEAIDKKYFYEIPATMALNNAVVKQELKAGKEINGAHLEQNTRLEIK